MAVCVYYEDKIHLIWNKIPEADGYKLYEKTDDHLYTSFKETTDNQVLLFYMNDGDELKIKPYKLENDEYVYDMGHEIIKIDSSLCSESLDYIVNIKKSCANIAWKKIKDADFYRLTVDGEVPVETENCEYFFECLPVGDVNILFEACSEQNGLITSENIPVHIDEMEIFALNSPNYKVTLRWNKVKDIDGYRLFQKNKKNEFEGFLSVSGEESALITNVARGITYEFKVKPYRLDGKNRVYSGMSAKCKVRVFATDKIDLNIIEAYDNKLAISYYFDGDVDGFDLFKNGEQYLNIEDGLSHISIIDYDDAEFFIKGYKYFCGDKFYVCESETKKICNKRDYAPESYKVSIVIPAYNSEDYISRTIATVLCSSIDDIELVIVDDGSKDGTKNVLDWYSKKYPNFVKVIYKENSGVCDTRNKGIEFANGKYIAFMDNDDMIRPKAFENLFNAIERTGADIVVAPLYRIDNDKYIVRHRLPFEENKAIDSEDYLRLLFSDRYNNIGIWNKLYRAELVKKHPLANQAYEDVSWTPYIISWADKFCYLNEICYEWDRKIRPSTQSNYLSNRSAEEKFKERYDACKFFFEEGNPKHRDCLMYLMAKRLYGQGKKANYEGYFDVIRSMRSELSNNRFLLEDEEFYKKISVYL